MWGETAHGAEILNPDNIMAIADRLLVRVINGKPVVIFSRRGRAERGKQVHKVGKFIGIGAPGEDGEVKDSEDLEKAAVKKGTQYVVTCFHSDDEIVFHAYNNRNCETLRTSITTRFIKAWIEQDEERKQAKERSEFLKRVADARKTLRLHATGIEQDEDDLREAQKLVDQHNLEQKKEEQEEIAEGEALPAPAPGTSRPSTWMPVMKAGAGSDGRVHQAEGRSWARLVHPRLMKENLLLLQWLIDRLRIVEYRISMR